MGREKIHVPDFPNQILMGPLGETRLFHGRRIKITLESGGSSEKKTVAPGKGM
jgi:hypothetical protein